MADEIEQPEVEVPAAEEKPKKPRKPRKPRAPKTEKPPKASKKSSKADEDEDDDEEFPCAVIHEGSKVLLLGPSIKLRVMTPAEQKQHGVKSITGIIGAPCHETQPTTITFKTAKQALMFFDMCLHAEDEGAEFIELLSDGNDVSWDSNDMQELL